MTAILSYLKSKVRWTHGRASWLVSPLLVLIPPLLVLSLAIQATTGQQAYNDPRGYTCGVRNASCETYAYYRTQGNSTTLAWVAKLFGVNALAVANASNINTADLHDTHLLEDSNAGPGPLEDSTPLYIPVSCGCNSPTYMALTNFQVELSGAYPFGRSMSAIANSTFQGTTTGVAMKAANPTADALHLEVGTMLRIPLRCACPSSAQANIAGTRLLLTYPVFPNESLSSIGARFSVPVALLAAANNLTDANYALVAFTTVLVPVAKLAPLPPMPLPARLKPSSENQAVNSGVGILGIILPALLVPASVLFVAAFYLIAVLFKQRQLKPRHRKPPPRLHHYSPRMGGTYHEVHRYTFKEVVDMTDDWKHELGKGGFGSVYLGILPCAVGAPHSTLHEEHKVALKKLSATSQQGLAEFLNEVNLLSRVHHSKLVSLVGYCDEMEQVLIYEYVEEGTLDSWLYGSKAGNPHFDWERRLHVALDAALGIDYLHTGAKPSIIHRDVKSNNILLTKNWQGRVADFGLSKTGFDTENNKSITTMVKGTIGYLDPEYYEYARLTSKSDVYSFGIVLLEIVTSRKPVDMNVLFSEHRSLSEFVKLNYDPNNLNKILNPNSSINYYSSESVCKVVELALKCLARASVDRPCMTDVVNEIKDAIRLENLHRPLDEQRCHERHEANLDGTMNYMLSSTSIPTNDSSTFLPR